MKYNKKGITIIEILIASLFFSIIFVGLLGGINVISSYVKESNIKLSAMNLAKAGIEKIDVFRVDSYLKTPYDKWGNFIGNFGEGYYSFSGSNIEPKFINEDLVIDFNNWEGPLDSSGFKKDSDEGLSFYRIIKLAGFDVKSDNKNKEDISIFNCNIKNNFCDDGISKTRLSYPYLSGAVLNGNKIELEFSTGSIFNTPSLFVAYIGTGSSTMNSDIGYTDFGNLEDIGDIMYIDFTSFSGSNYNNLDTKSINLSGYTFSGSYIFGNNVSIGQSINKAIYNIRNSIRENSDEFTAYIFYPNSCILREQFVLYNKLSDTTSLFPMDLSNDCGQTVIDINNNKLTLSGSYIGNYNNNFSINPTYHLKINMGNTSSGYTLFRDLISSRVTDYGLEFGKSGFSSIYKLGVRVVGVENGEIKVNEVFQTYLGDL